MVDYICIECQYVGRPKYKKRGSDKLNRVGWFVFPLNVPYILWRTLTKLKSCRHCNGQVFSVTSLEGSHLVATLDAELAATNLKPKAQIIEPEKPKLMAPETLKPHAQNATAADEW